MTLAAQPIRTPARGFSGSESAVIGTFNVAAPADPVISLCDGYAPCWL